ncbi:MAG: HAD family hydrolase [Candidatus Acidiferrum sp.]
MVNISCSGVLFDLDGVLVDSTPAVTRVWTTWALGHGLDPEYVVRMAHGRPSIASIRELLPQADHEAEDHEVERREIADVDGVIPLPGALELLRALPVERWAIATSCTRELAYVRIRAAGLPLPRQLITSSDVRKGKPDPEPYLMAAASLGLPAGNCIVVEDAPAGIRAGKSAGACVLALRTTASNEEILHAGADWIVDDLSALRLSEQPRDGKIILRMG